MNNNEILKGVIWSLKRIVNAIEGMTAESPDAASRNHTPSVDTICEEVAYMWHLNPKAIHSRRRWEPLATARQVAMYLAYELTDFRASQLAKYFKRDKSDITYAVLSIKQRMEIDYKFERRVEAVRASLTKQTQ